MSKSTKLVAGLGVVAGLAVAVAPLSAFADDTVTDTLQVTIDSSITFGLDNNEDGDYDDPNEVAPVTHTNGAGTWAGGNNNHLKADTLSKTMAGGETSDSFGTTALTVISNNASGYQIKAVGQALAGSGTAAGKSIAKGTTLDGTVSNWAYKASATGMTLNGITANAWAAAPDTATKIASRDGISAATGDTLTVTYGIGIAGSQEAGTYSGTMVYTVSAAE